MSFPTKVGLWLAARLSNGYAVMGGGVATGRKAYNFDGVDDNVTSSVAISVNSGDTFKFKAKLTPATGTPRYFFRSSGSLFFNLWSEGQVYREGCIIKIDGITYDNWSDAPTDGKEHLIEVSFSVAGSINYLFADSDGVRAIDFQLYDMEWVLSGVREVFPMNEGSGGTFTGSKGTILTINNFSEEYWADV